MKKMARKSNNTNIIQQKLKSYKRNIDRIQEQHLICSGIYDFAQVPANKNLSIFTFNQNPLTFASYENQLYMAPHLRAKWSIFKTMARNCLAFRVVIECSILTEQKWEQIRNHIPWIMFVLSKAAKISDMDKGSAVKQKFQSPRFKILQQVWSL